MTRFLQRVSITGADDRVNPKDLVELSQKYPFVEWALLYLPEKEGHPRNPDKEWRLEFLTLLSKAEKGHPGHRNRLALHLCGKLAFYQLLANVAPSEFRRYGRVQINANARGAMFTVDQMLEIYEKALKIDAATTVILQAHEYTEDIIGAFLTRFLPEEVRRINVLNDTSRGRGVVPDNWYSDFRGAHACLEGFAGGLGPDNIADNLPKLAALEVPHWIDMESGVRTDNQFDLAKVERVLHLCQPYVQQP